MLLTENLISKANCPVLDIDISVFHVNIGRDLQVRNSTDSE